MQVIGQIAMEGMKWRLREHEMLFMNSATQVACENREVRQSFGRGQAFFYQIARPAARLHRLMPPVPDNCASLTQDVPFGLERGRDIRMHKLGFLSACKAEIDTGVVRIGDIMPDSFMFNATHADDRIRDQIENP